MAAVNVKRLKIMVFCVIVVGLTFLEMKCKAVAISMRVIHFHLLIYTSLKGRADAADSTEGRTRPITAIDVYRPVVFFSNRMRITFIFLLVCDVGSHLYFISKNLGLQLKVDIVTSKVRA